MRRVRILAGARTDIGRLVAFLQDKSPVAANKAAARITQGILSLGEFAERGRKGPFEELRELVVRFGRDADIIQYRVGPSEVIVARVFHSRQDRR